MIILLLAVVPDMVVVVRIMPHRGVAVGTKMMQATMDMVQMAGAVAGTKNPDATLLALRQPAAVRGHRPQQEARLLREEVMTIMIAAGSPLVSKMFQQAQNPTDLMVVSVDNHMPSKIVSYD